MRENAPLLVSLRRGESGSGPESLASGEGCVSYPRGKMPRYFLEVPREASPVASLYPKSDLCKCVKGLLLGSHSVGAPQGGTPHSKPAQDNAEPSPAKRGGSQEAL